MLASNYNQYEALAEKLHARRNELLEDIMARVRENESDLAAHLDAQLSANEDDAVANELIDLNLKYVEGEIGKLRGVQEAEERMKEGTYGVCVDCHRDINADKLQLQPSSSRCAECEVLYEHTLTDQDHGYH